MIEKAIEILEDLCTDEDLPYYALEAIGKAIEELEVEE